MQNKKHSWFKRTFGSFALMTVLVSNGTAQAAILFQDDTFHDIESEAILIDSNGTGADDTSIQFGNDAVGTENGTINWNVTTNTFEFDHEVDITGGLTSDGNVDFSSADQNLFRNDSDPNTNSACQALGEVIINTTTNRLEVCTTTGIAGVAVWSAPATTIPTGAADPGTCSVGELFFNTTLGELRVCTSTNTFETAGPQDFESVYGHDGDDTLTTSGGDFTVATGGGDQNFTLGAGEFDITSTGLLDFNAGSFDMDLTGGFAVDAVGASNVTTDSGSLTLSTTTSGDVDVTGADDVNVTGGTNVDIASTAGDITLTAGDDLFFDDAQLVAPVQLTDTATAIDATYGTTGIIDALNSLASTATGAGASNVGVEDAGGYFTGTDVEAALQELGAGSAQNYEVLNFSPEYPDAVLFADGTANRGRMDALYDSANAEHHYRWTSRNAALQDYDIRFRFPLPEDFTDVNDFTFRYRTGTAVVGSNRVDVTVNNDTDGATCGSSTSNTTANVWATGTIAEATLETGCTAGTALDAGDIVEVLIKLYDNSGAADFADIGVLALGYDN